MRDPDGGESNEVTIDVETELVGWLPVQSELVLRWIEMLDNQLAVSLLSSSDTNTILTDQYLDT